MLSGQEISLLDSLLISVVGMAVVMLELMMLALFITLMSKVLNYGGRLSKKDAKAQAKPAAKPAVKQETAPAAVAPNAAAEPDVSDEEFAAILVSVCAETRRSPEQIMIRSVTKV